MDAKPHRDNRDMIGTKEQCPGRTSGHGTPPPYKEGGLSRQSQDQNSKMIFKISPPPTNQPTGMKLTPKTHTPEDPQPIAWTVAKFIPLLMLLAQRQDKLFSKTSELERRIHKINAGFVLTPFEQIALFKLETHSLIAGIDALIHQVEMWDACDKPKPENTPE